jgi:hydroxymethylbilane synthase
MRGNVATRLGKLGAGEADATFLAAAGLNRLGIETGVLLPLNGWLPAPGQGAVGLACRAEDSATHALLAAVSHADTATAVVAERAFLARLGGTCRTAVAAHAAPQASGWNITAELYEPEGTARITGSLSATEAELPHAAAALAERLLAEATPTMLAALA